MSVVARRRATALAIVAVLAAVTIGITALAGGGGSGLPEDAVKLVPANALVYVHVSTDAGRDASKRAAQILSKFPSWPRLRDGLISRLSAGGAAAATTTDVRPWLGKEVALALLDAKGGTAGSLVLVDVSDRKRAQAFLTRGAFPGGRPTTYRGTELQGYGAVTAAFVGHFLVLGQPATVRQAIDLDAGRGRSLAADDTYRRATAGEPGDRVADAYVTADGIHRLLAPAGGLLGAAGALLDRPGLRGTALTISASDPGAVLRVHSVATPPANSQTFQPFEPKLPSSLPTGALAAVDIRGLDRAGGRLAQVAGSTGLGAFVAVARKALGAKASLQLLDLLRNEVAIVVLPGVPVPTLAVVAQAKDSNATRGIIGRLMTGMQRLLRGSKLTQTRVAGEDVTVLQAGTRFTLQAAVFAGKLVLATGSEGIAAIRGVSGGGLAATKPWQAVVHAPSSRPTSLVFLDFSQLLQLAEATGLRSSRAYLAARGDLEKVHAVGAASTGSGGNTTVEIRLQIR